MPKLLLNLAFEIPFLVKICEAEGSVALALNQVADLQSSVSLNCTASPVEMWMGVILTEEVGTIGEPGGTIVLISKPDSRYS